jgi:hypothetical protein
MRCKVEGGRQMGASRGLKEIVMKDEQLAADVRRLVGAKPALPLRQQQMNQQQQIRNQSPQQKLEKLPSCLKSSFRRGQRDKIRPLLDNGEGKSMSVSFAPEVVFQRGRAVDDTRAQPVLSVPDMSQQPQQQRWEQNTQPAQHNHGISGGRAVASSEHLASPVAPAPQKPQQTRWGPQQPQHSRRGDDEEWRPSLTPQLGTPPPDFQREWNNPPELFHGLTAPRLLSGEPVVGEGKQRHRLENKRKRISLQVEQEPTSYWTHFEGKSTLPHPVQNPTEWKGQMCPRNLAMHHPAAATLLQYATGGCPVKSGSPWTKEEIIAAIERGNHISAQQPEAIAFHMAQVEEKVKNNQCRIVLWDDIKDNIPPQLKVSPLAMVPHKSRAFRAILDLSFGIRLDDGSMRTSVNDSTEKTAPYGAIDQLGHSLSRIIHALAEVDDDSKVFFAKFDIKDGFWRLDAAAGEEWNFCYVLPQPEGEPTRLVVPTSLQMGWVESPAYFCAASETGRDVAARYAELQLGSLPPHKFSDLTQTHADFQTLPVTTDDNFSYFLECYVDDYMSMAVATSQQQLNHIASALMHGIHDVFPPHEDPDQDSLSYKKIKKGEAAWAVRGDLLGFTVDGGIGPKSIWLEEPKRDKLLVILQQWIRAGNTRGAGVEYAEFRSVIYKIRHAFVAIPNGVGLLSPCNDVLRREPAVVYFHRNKALLEALRDIRTLLWESICEPTLCKTLVNGWPGYVAIVDASKHGVGIVVIGEALPCVPTVCRVQWPDCIKKAIVSESNPDGTITNSDLESAGALLAWLVVECICDITPGTHVAIYSDNEAMVVRVKKKKARARVAGFLIRALSLRLKYAQASPLTPLHIQGKQNGITDVPSRSFGSEPTWHWKTHQEFYANFNSMFPLPSQHSWSVFVLNFAVFMKVVCVLQMKPSSLEEWRRLPKIGRYIGPTGPALFGLLEWTHTWRVLPSKNNAECSQPSLDLSELDSSVMDGKSKLQQSLRTSLPLARRSVWPATLTLQK